MSTGMMVAILLMLPLITVLGLNALVDLFDYPDDDLFEPQEY